MADLFTVLSLSRFREYIIENFRTDKKASNQIKLKFPMTTPSLYLGKYWSKLLKKGNIESQF